MDSPDAGAMCVDDADCSDGIFCNGSERCAPAEAGADGRGCVAASDPCFEGQECSESEGRCVTVDCSMPDLDGDGTESIDCGGTDCDDGDDTRFPGNPEICDAEGHDEDCDPATLGPDADGDGFAAIDCCNGSLCGQDCDDELAGISPDAVEACNGVDEDCDGDLDEGAREVFYRDLDGDGFGDPASPVTRACVEDPLFSRQADDCDDRDTGTHPGAAELCDGRDNDCNASTAHDQDADGDGHLPTDAICTGGDLPKDDCDDANPFANGGAPERCSGIDDDCDGTIDEAAADDWCTMQAHSGSDTTATALCGVAGTCTLAACGAGRADCDGVLGNGCETDLEASADDCGACGVTCPSGVCTGGVCQRETGPTAATMVALRSGHHAVCALTA
ncbi:MAG: hypothetical protein GWN07_03580, partial [Actinobacteria bacterium]|nr:hypothetical protein [Actinomycetota bacterium]NIX18961.1 hypothetical protein [Actinomycetota bacterium]